MKKLLTLVVLLLCDIRLLSAAEKIRFVLAGDSTVTDDAGWGRAFAELLSDDAECINLAKGGRSSRSYRTEGWWQKCLEAKPRYLLIQFGHNDQRGKGPERESAAETDFRDHLRAFVREAREQEIQPVLVTSPTRRRWSKDGRIEPTLADYAEATSLVARQLNVPLIDLHRLSIQQCEQLGPEAFRAFEPMTDKGADHTHLNVDGGRAVAPLVALAMIGAVPESKPFFVQQRIDETTVPRPYERSLTSGALQLEETDATVTIRQSAKVVLTYNKLAPKVPEGIDPVFARTGFLHPVGSPNERTVTEVYPFDHAHQSGIFSAWVKTRWNDREIDFWNLAGGTGRVLHQRVLNTFANQGSVGFEVDMVHRALQSPVVDLLRDRWKVTASETDGSFHSFDIESTQTALTDIPLIVQKYHYGGMAFRGSVRWLTEKDNDSGKDRDVGKQSGQTSEREPGSFLNEHGSDRIKGNHEKTRWVSFSGTVHGQPVTLTVLSHAQNFRAPQAARIHPTKPYFVFSPCVEDEFVIDREHPLQCRYRFLITDQPTDNDWIEQQWAHWCEQDN